MTELWSLLNFIDYHQFDNDDAFLNKFGEMKDKESVGTLHEYIYIYILC